MLQVIDDRVVFGVEHFGGARLAGLHLHAIHGRHGIWHDEHVRVSAGCRRRAAGDHGLLVGLSGIAEMHVRVFESGGDGHRRGVHGRVRVGGDDEVNDFAGVPDLDVVKGEGHDFRTSLPRRSSRNGIPDGRNAPDGTSAPQARWW